MCEGVIFYSKKGIYASITVQTNLLKDYVTLSKKIRVGGSGMVITLAQSEYLRMPARARSSASSLRPIC